MKRLVIFLVGIVVFSISTAYAWIGDRQLEEIEWRVKETEERLLDLNEEQLRNWAEWLIWGIDILTKESREMEIKIAKSREEWRELKNKKMTSQEAWQEWERVGRELEELERKKNRLDSILGRLKDLKEKLEMRVKELREKPKPVFKPEFAVGIGLNEAKTVIELKITVYPRVDFFCGGELQERTRYSWWGEEEKYYVTKFSYFGGEYRLGEFGNLKFPIGVIVSENIHPSLGVLLEFQRFFLQARFAPAFEKEDTVYTVVLGVKF